MERDEVPGYDVLVSLSPRITFLIFWYLFPENLRRLRRCTALPFFARSHQYRWSVRALMESNPGTGGLPIAPLRWHSRQDRLPFRRRHHRHPRHRLELHKNVQRRSRHCCRLYPCACPRSTAAADAAPGCPSGRVPPRRSQLRPLPSMPLSSLSVS